MIFNPKQLEPTGGFWQFSGAVTATAHHSLCNAVFADFWKGFSFACSEITISETSKLEFCIGNVSALPLKDFSYAINITPDGVCISAKDEQALIHGYMTLLDRIRTEGDGLALDCCQIWDMPKMQNRMVHFCIFPQTQLWELQRFIRMCGALKYTHIILEFWGTLQYDCLKALSWPGSFTKEQVRPLIAEANTLGMEVIPMFNHWGHASASRVCHGKHVVLDQNPALQSYFTPDGWCWDITKDKVRALLGKIREELTDLCGEGSYFHIGCDEAYNFPFTKENMDLFCGFVNEIQAEMAETNRQVILWGDMFLYPFSHYRQDNRYYCNGPTPEGADYMLDHLSKDIIIGDWQYRSKFAPIETPAVFSEKGFACLLCSWDMGMPHMAACVDSVNTQNLFGLMHTTWHTLSTGMPYVTVAAAESYDGLPMDTEKTFFRIMRSATSALLRKVYPVNGDYEKAGWAPCDIITLG